MRRRSAPERRSEFALAGSAGKLATADRRHSNRCHYIAQPQWVCTTPLRCVLGRSLHLQIIARQVDSPELAFASQRLLCLTVQRKARALRVTGCHVEEVPGAKAARGFGRHQTLPQGFAVGGHCQPDFFRSRYLQDEIAFTEFGR